jgi:hypothetical protein
MNRAAGSIERDDRAVKIFQSEPRDNPLRRYVSELSAEMVDDRIFPGRAAAMVA